VCSSDLWDLILTPIYLLVLTFLAKQYRDRKYPVGHYLRRYYLPGLYVKFGGAIFIALVYQYYYGGGDTMNFYEHSKIINSVFSQDVSSWWKVLRRVSPDSSPEIYQYASTLYWYNDPSSYTVASISAVFGLLNGTTYIPIALMFAFLSYTGIWAMYKTFVELYPSFHKQLAIAFIFIPSTFVWGSAIFKDTVCMFALGWMTYCTFRIFIHKDFSVKNIFLLVLSFYLLAVIKIYIVLAFVPGLGFWILMTYTRKLSSGTKWILNIAFIGIIALGFVYFTQKFAAELNEYSLENIVKKAKKTQDWITYVSDASEGSAYDIGELDGTVGGMLSKFPQAVNVTLYRPYIWESKKPIILLSALEASAFLVLTLMVFYRRGLFKTFKSIFADANLSFFFIYTVIFAFAVGISTGNFGSLSRYKIPCMPFFAGLLLVLYQQSKKPVATKKITANARKPVHRLA